MGWQSDDGRHEGWVAATFADGVLGAGWGSGGVLLDVDAGEGGLRYRPESEVTGWVTACACGWRGQPWIRVTDPAAHDPDARLIYSRKAFVPPEVERAGHDEWRPHIGPDAILAEVADLAAEQARVARHLAEAVGRARAAGASWAAIGAAAGITRQSAHERWRDVAAAGAEGA